MKKTTLSKKIFYTMIVLGLFAISIVLMLWLIYIFNNYQKDVYDLKANHVREQKRVVSNSVKQLIEHISQKVDRLHLQLQNDLKNDVSNSYNIAYSIYDQNKDKLSKKEIINNIKETLRDVRYGNNNRYIIINSLEGRNILCSARPYMEGRFLFKIKDIDGESSVKKQINFVKNNKEGILKTYWRDFDESGNELKRLKLFYLKVIPELNLYIAIGKYLDDFEKEIQKELIYTISKLRYGKFGYFWINTFYPKMIMHPTVPSLNGEDLSIYRDPNGNDLFNKMVAVCKEKGEGFVSYNWPKPGEMKIKPKLSFVKAYKKWNWIIGSGIYLDEVEKSIAQKEEELKSDIAYIIGFSLLFNLILFYIIYLVFQKVHNDMDKSFNGFYKFMESSFKTKNLLDTDSFRYLEFQKLAQYTNNMVSQRLDYEKEIVEFNENLESLVEKRTSDLKQTQKRLIESEKMASLGELVAGVAHEINTPVGVGLTGITHLENLNKKIIKLYESKDMGEEDFEEYLEKSKVISQTVTSNLLKAADLIKSFKQVAVDQSSESKRTFNLKEYIEEILLSIHNVTKKTKHNILVQCPELLNFTSYPGAISQVVTNLIMNSLIHAYTKEDSGKININITDLDDKIELIYQDDGKGIKKENLAKVCDPFFTTNRNHGGSGLGMNIVYNIIQSKLKGSMNIESQENEGVKITIILPKMEE